MNETTPPAAPAKRWTRYLTIVARILMGLVFLPAGAMYFLNMMPEPKEPPPQPMMDFAGAMMKTGYLFALVKGTETVAGLLLLINRFVPLALVIIAPVIVNIVLANSLLAHSAYGLSAVIVLLELYLAWAYRSAFRPLLAAKWTPNN
jgi:uncharacterized membrane protein YphA (DoxX/SURF4 family)